MNKVICDICGTMYPENASQCPICGCAKPEDANVVPAEGTGADAAAGAYSYTKGGHFSKSNVKKRNKAVAKAPKAVAAAAAAKKNDEENGDNEENSGESNKGLIIAIVLLIIAIVGMLCYIFFTYFAGDIFGGNDPVVTTQTTVTTTGEIKCQDLDLQVPGDEITLDKADHAWLLTVIPSPFDTTDEITFTSSDPNVAKVSSDGRVTAVGAGTATITVTCGDVVKQCQVVCDIETEPTTEATTEPTTDATTEATTEATTKPTEPKPDLSKFHTDVLGSKYDNDCRLNVGDSCTIVLRDGDGNKVDVTWSATVEGYFEVDGNKITGIKPTPLDSNEADKVRAVCTYEGVEFSVIIRVLTPVVVIPPTEPTEYTGPTIDDPGYEISHTDVTIRGGEKFTLTLKDSNGQPVEAVWTPDKGGIVAIDGNVITGKTKGKTIVSYRVANYVYECIVRVSSTVKDDGAVG